MRWPGIIVCLTLPMSLSVCKVHPGSADASLDADGQDTDGADQPTAPFRLVFEPGAQACARFSDYRTAAQELGLRSRVWFEPGNIWLARDADSFEIDLIERVQVIGPYPIEAISQDSGRMTHQTESGPWGVCHRYEYTQAFSAQARALSLVFSFSFCFKDGVQDPSELRFDLDRVGQEPQGYVEDSQLDLRGFLDQGQDYLTEMLFYGSCTYATLPRFCITVELEGQDSLVIHKRYLRPQMGSGPATITHAQIQLNGNSRVVDDYFHLAYAADLHNFNQRYLVFLAEPLGDVHAVHFEETDQDHPPTVVDLLGADLDLAHPLEQRLVQSYLEEEF